MTSNTTFWRTLELHIFHTVLTHTVSALLMHIALTSIFNIMHAFLVSFDHK